MEKIKKQHEDAVVEELRIALPHIHLTEIRRLVKEHEGDGNKVLEFLTSVEPQEAQLPQSDNPSQDLPNGIPIPNESQQDSQQDPLSPSMELLSLNLEPPQQSHNPSTPWKKIPFSPPYHFQQQTSTIQNIKHDNDDMHLPQGKRNKQNEHKRTLRNDGSEWKRWELKGWMIPALYRGIF